MRNSILIENKAYLQSFLNDNIWTKRYYHDFFPLKYCPTLTFDYLIADKGADVTADVVAYGSEAPEKGRETVDKKCGDIPAVRVKRIMDESDLNKYHIMLGQQNTPKKQIMDFVFDDPTFVYNAVEARREYMALHALSNFTLSFTGTTNPDGIITQTDIDYQLAAANKRSLATATATRSWANGTSSNYTPITDFWELLDAIEDAGKAPPKYALMNTTNWRQFCVADDVIDLANQSVFNQPSRITADNINGALRNIGLPQVIVVDTRIRTEADGANGVGVRTTTNPWTDNYVTFLPDMAVGEMLYSFTSAGLHEPSYVMKSEKSGILVSKWSDVDPVAEITKGESNCVPIIPNVSNCWRLAVTTTNADGLDD